GGLGPTPDDVTRKAGAGALDRPLQLDEEVLARIRERAKRSGRKLPASVESQALLPRGARAWANPVGTAPGILIEQREKPVILLPGVPQEMEALATEFVIPFLRERTGRHVESFTLRTLGLFESQLQERIGALPKGRPGAGQPGRHRAGNLDRAARETRDPAARRAPGDGSARHRVRDSVPARAHRAPRRELHAAHPRPVREPAPREDRSASQGVAGRWPTR